MTQTHEPDTDAALQMHLDSILELAQQSPEIATRAIDTLEAHLILITEAADASDDKALIRAVDGIWEQLQIIRAMLTNQAISSAGVGIVMTTLKAQRDKALHIASQAIQQANGRKGA